MLAIVDEYTRETLGIRVAWRLNSSDVIDILSDLFILRGLPAYIGADNGAEFIAKSVWHGSSPFSQAACIMQAA